MQSLDNNPRWRENHLMTEPVPPGIEALLPPETYSAAHLNLIRLGREVCHARGQECARCVLRRTCVYYRSTIRA